MRGFKYFDLEVIVAGALLVLDCTLPCYFTFIKALFFFMPIREQLVLDLGDNCWCIEAVFASSCSFPAEVLLRNLCISFLILYRTHGCFSVCIIILWLEVHKFTKPADVKQRRAAASIFMPPKNWSTKSKRQPIVFGYVFREKWAWLGGGMKEENSPKINSSQPLL